MRSRSASRVRELASLSVGMNKWPTSQPIVPPCSASEKDATAKAMILIMRQDLRVGVRLRYDEPAQLKQLVARAQHQLRHRR